MCISDKLHVQSNPSLTEINGRFCIMVIGSHDYLERQTATERQSMEAQFTPQMQLLFVMKWGKFLIFHSSVSHVVPDIDLEKCCSSQCISALIQVNCKLILVMFQQ
ncbi:fibronectin type-III domain-containing protein 3a-like [Platysternon megacephalum]|uniref:Fibronectin type-III domain-containing protein 3a-like n=1 Tax=Platysternon megacephalum TaxID=55544 RepID=A0A4D9FE07_9SAUR|nr:fibronectin type-III domain-containing protein 3a-like [Platysternon megacephalum]